MRQVLLIIGASGVGKTTTAQALKNRIDGVEWIHPDGIWDTENLESERILELALSRAADSSLNLIDCQIRPSALPEILDSSEIEAWLLVLLVCPRSVLEARLTERGWTSAPFERISRWANILKTEATAAGHPIVDTSQHPIDLVCDLIVDHCKAAGLIT